MVAALQNMPQLPVHTAPAGFAESGNEHERHSAAAAGCRLRAVETSIAPQLNPPALSCQWSRETSGLLLRETSGLLLDE